MRPPMSRPAETSPAETGPVDPGPAETGPAGRAAKLTPLAFQRLIDAVPLARALAIRSESLSFGRATLRLPSQPLGLRPGGTISGPAMMTLADVALWGAILSMLGPVALAVTTDLTAHFLKKPQPGDLLGHATTLQLGRRLAIADCRITGTTDDRPLAHAVGTYALPEGPT